MLKDLFRPGAPFPIDRDTCVAYTKELADGIKLWGKINAVVVPLTILLWIIGIVPTVLLGLVVLFAVGCPVIMILGFAIGCLRYLTVRECFVIVSSRLSTSQ